MADNQEEDKDEGYSPNQNFTLKSSPVTQATRNIIFTLLFDTHMELKNGYILIGTRHEKETSSGIILDSKESSDKFIVGEEVISGDKVVFNQYLFDRIANVDALGDLPAERFDAVFIGKQEGIAIKLN